MFYSTNDFYKYLKTDASQIPPQLSDGWLTYLQSRFRGAFGQKPITRKRAAKVLSEIKQAIVDREDDYDLNRHYSINVGKFARPWHVVDKLRNFRPPQGDYGIGVEVEYGFNSHSDATDVVMHIKNWRHIAVDKEGWPNGIETTFAPTLYSKMNKKSQCFRYLDYLRANLGKVHPHDPSSTIGTHVNVSAHERLSSARCHRVRSTIEYMGHATKERFFGRPQPYGAGVVRPTTGGHNYIEWKLFNSTTDSKKLREYINVAVSLTKLVEGNDIINMETVTQACERGLLGRVK